MVAMEGWALHKRKEHAVLLRRGEPEGPQHVRRILLVLVWFIIAVRRGCVASWLIVAVR